MRKCTHPPLDAFIAYRSKGGSKVWRCSHCGKEDVWRDSWCYYGPLECRCGGPGVEAVMCSDACRAAFRPRDPRLALELAALKLEARQGA